MNTYLVYLPSYLMIFCLISNISCGETRDDDRSMNEHESKFKMPEPIARSTGKGLKTMRGMLTDK